MKISTERLKQIIEEEILSEVKVGGTNFARVLIKRINGLSKSISLYDVAGIDEALFNELQDAMTTLQASYQQMVEAATSKGQGDMFDPPAPKPKKKPFSWKD